MMVVVVVKETIPLSCTGHVLFNCRLTHVT